MVPRPALVLHRHAPGSHIEANQPTAKNPLPILELAFAQSYNIPLMPTPLAVAA